MTYTFSGFRQQEGHANVTATFDYIENILFPPKEKSGKRWQTIVEKVNQERNARQTKVKNTIVHLLKTYYNAKGLRTVKDYTKDGQFRVTNEFLERSRYYEAESNGTHYTIRICGELKPSEHLEDMLDCGIVDAELAKLFRGKK